MVIVPSQLTVGQKHDQEKHPVCENNNARRCEGQRCRADQLCWPALCINQWRMDWSYSQLSNRNEEPTPNTISALSKIISLKIGTQTLPQKFSSSLHPCCSRVWIWASHEFLNSCFTPVRTSCSFLNHRDTKTDLSDIVSHCRESEICRLSWVLIIRKRSTWLSEGNYCLIQHVF